MCVWCDLTDKALHSIKIQYVGARDNFNLVSLLLIFEQKIHDNNIIFYFYDFIFFNQAILLLYNVNTQ